MRKENQERPTHPIYKYAVITDSVEGLILTDVGTLSDGEPRNNFLERALTWNAGGVLDGARDITIGGHFAYVAVTAGVAIIDLDDPLNPKHLATVELTGVRSIFQQFRFLFITDADGLKTIDITKPDAPFVVPDNTIEMADAHKIYVARTYAYVAGGTEGVYIVDVEDPTAMKVYMIHKDGIVDAHDVVVATTNASLIGYVADGEGGLKVLQLTSPESQPRFYGFSPEPKPETIAHYKTKKPALSLSRGLERDRAVDETGGQVAVFSRLGSGPLHEEDMKRLYLKKDGKPWFVTDELPEQNKQAEQK